MQSLAKKTVIVTVLPQDSEGLLLLPFAHAGAKVGMIARTEEGLRDAQHEIERGQNNGIAIAAADTGDPQQLAAAVNMLETQLGPFDIWVNNAMETIFSRFIDITPEEFKRATEVTYLGFVYGTMEAMKRMEPRNSGHIIQVGSALAYRAIPLQSAYCGSKFAVRGFTDALRCELIHNGSAIRLTTVHMPALNTPQFSWARTHITHQPKPVGTIFQPELGADAVVHAARYPCREYWVGGSTVAAIIGNMFFSGWMDRMMARMSYEQQWVKDEQRPVQDGNLFQPATANLHTTRGQFGEQASMRSTTWSIIKWLSTIFASRIHK